LISVANDKIYRHIFDNQCFKNLRCGHQTSQSSQYSEITQAQGNRPAAILQTYGLITVGRSLDAEVGLFMAMESAYRSQLLAEAAGGRIS
jgi:ribulose-5-phosphate 4-epimerase/fuculose-1-phosphate aldolase